MDENNSFETSLFLWWTRTRLEELYITADWTGRRNKYPMKKSVEMFNRLTRAFYFSKIDFNTIIHRIIVCPEEIETNELNKKYGKYEYPVLNLGLWNAPETFRDWRM